ncbi:MAG: fatty-acyl-CoA synthase [Solirubrobacteraceae bacterium]|jgi:acyl-CoA synthetase (AMP-forming)/AMP-acid ligase II|nr:fatty-acyl-CoA synthase [Solirubrobacteraceae bacterium]
MSLTSILVHHAERFPDRVALEYDGTETTWAQLLDGTRRTAGVLREVGVQSGDVVGVLLHNSDRFVELMHAISHIGAIFMPINWRLAGAEIAYIVEHSGAAVLVSEPELEPLLEPVRDQLACRLLRAQGPAGDGWDALDELRESVAPAVDAVPLDEDDVHRLMYTSGTTSRPKGVMITYGNLNAKNASHVVEFGMTAEGVNLACGPLYHVGALDLTTSTMMYLGARTHIVRRFEPTAVLDAIERHRITDVWLAPVMIKLLVDQPDIGSRDLSSVRLIIDGGEKMPLPLIERVLSAFPNAWFADAYGLTETVSGDTVLDKGRSRDKIGSVGKPVVHLELRVVDDEGNDVAAGERGEVILRGPKVCKGYWRDEKATAAALRNGWFHTGDLGVLDEDGFLFIVDRLKDVIISGGENIASSEVERAIYEHAAVAEVAVVGRPDERWLEVPVAYVALAEGVADVSAADLEAHCRQRLAGYKVPKAFQFVDALPRNPSGKVLKRELRDRERDGDAGAPEATSPS